MTSIDEAIAHAREIADKSSDCWKHCVNDGSCSVCEKEHEQLAEWLEELKSLKENSISKEAFEKMKSIAYKKGRRQGYNKALDDFVKFASDMPTVEEEDGEIRPMRLEEIAEQLKAGVGSK